MKLAKFFETVQQLFQGVERFFHVVKNRNTNLKLHT